MLTIVLVLTVILVLVARRVPGGPAGLALAVMLGRLGRRVLVLEL